MASPADISSRYGPCKKQTEEPRRHMNEILLVFSAGVVAGIVIGILLVHD
jgi:hypothetical protein